VYGRDTVPASIKFSTRNFLFVDWQSYSFEVVPMVYDTALQNKIVSEAISVGLEYAAQYERIISKDVDSIQPYVEILASICVDWCISMKHPQFEVEKEWRLAMRWGLEHRVLTGRAFRASPTGIVPYLRMRPKADELIDATLAISSVTIGPCNHPEIQRRTLREFLFQHGHADAEVNISNLPLRV